MLWESRQDVQFAAKNLLTNDEKLWRAEQGQKDEQGFVMRVGNSAKKVVGATIKNTPYSKNGGWATKDFRLEGSLLRDTETLAQRTQGFNPTWTPEEFRKAGNWSVLLTNKMYNQRSNPTRDFFFEAVTELRFVWFYVLSFYKEGGGLQYFAPIFQSGLYRAQQYTCHPSTTQMCANGVTGQAAIGSVMKKTLGTRRGVFKRKTTSLKMLHTSVMGMRHLDASKSVKVYLLTNIKIKSLFLLILILNKVLNCFLF